MIVKKWTEAQPRRSHKGTTKGWTLMENEFKEFKGYTSPTEMVSEFETETEVAPHVHPNSEELYFVLEGRGIMRVGEEKKEVFPRDLIYIPPNTEHSIRALDKFVRCLAFIIAVK